MVGPRAAAMLTAGVILAFAARPALADLKLCNNTPNRVGVALGYKDAKPPEQEQEALQRRKVMRRARSKKQRPILLAELERRYLDAP